MKICILAPCFNEADGIGLYIRELDQQLGDVNLILFDDFSTDGTYDVIRATKIHELSLTPFRNSKNLGHGGTVRKAWDYAVARGFSVIVLVDGDGQIPSFDIKKALEIFRLGQIEILEGVRVGRNDPWFRKLITRFLRLLVFFKSGQLPMDANTPFRIYTREALTLIKKMVPVTSPTPNIHVSILTRRLNLNYLEQKVNVRDRLGAITVGSTWNTKMSVLPGKKLIVFCLKSLKSLLLGK